MNVPGGVGPMRSASPDGEASCDGNALAMVDVRATSGGWVAFQYACEHYCSDYILAFRRKTPHTLPLNIPLCARKHPLIGSRLISHQTFPTDIGPTFRQPPFVRINFLPALFHVIWLTAVKPVYAKEILLVKVFEKAHVIFFTYLTTTYL